MKLKLPWTWPQRILEFLCLLCLLAQLLLPVLLWSRLPDPMPTHFNAAGEIDGWGSRATLFLFPGFSLLMWLFLGLCQRIDPKKWNIPFTVPWGREVPVYSAVKTMLIATKLETILIFAAMEVFSIRADSRMLDASAILLCVVMGLTLILGLVIAWRKRFR